MTKTEQNQDKNTTINFASVALKFSLPCFPNVPPIKETRLLPSAAFDIYLGPYHYHLMKAVDDNACMTKRK